MPINSSFPNFPPSSPWPAADRSGVDVSDDDDDVNDDDSRLRCWMREAARHVLMAGGVDAEDPASVMTHSEKISRSPQLRSAAAVLGLLPAAAAETEGHAAMIEAAQNDRLLWSIPSPDRLEICRRRARLIAWCMTGCVPTLSTEEREAARRLHAADDPFGVVHRLLTTPLENESGCVTEEKVKKKASRISPDEAAWIRELASLITIIPEDEFAEAEAAVGRLFGDGLPMTLSRLLACETLEAARRNGEAPAEDPLVRHLN